MNHFFSNILTMDIIDSDDSDLEMAFMEAVVIPSFRKQRKLPVPRQVNALSVANLLDLFINFVIVRNSFQMQFVIC